MRIEASNRSNGVASRSPAGKAGTGPAFMPSGAGGASRVASAVPLAHMAGLDAILALQNVGDYGESRRKAVKRGSTLLDALEAMKADLLVGQTKPERLSAMVSQLSTLRDRVDPDLDAIIDDIELRVRVELAKQGHYPAL